MNWRSLFGAWYVEDVIRARSNLTVSLGFRDEFSTGWNEANGRAANYTPGSTAPWCARHSRRRTFACRRWATRCSRSTARSSCRSRGSASPGAPSTRRRSSAPASACTTTCRTRWAIARTRTRPATRPTRSAPPASPISLARQASRSQPSAPPPTTPLALLLPGGVQPDMYTPTLVSYSLTGRAGAVVPTLRSAWATSAATAITRSSAWTPTRPLPWSVRRRRARRRSRRRSIPATGLPVYGALAGQAGAGGDVFQSHEHQAEHRARQYVDVGLRRAQHVQRAAGGS